MLVAIPSFPKFIKVQGVALSTCNFSGGSSFIMEYHDITQATNINLPKQV